MDYLRNGGVPIFRATASVQAGQTVLNNPQEQPVTASSQWQVVPLDDGGFQLKVVAREGEKSTTNRNYRIKGMCYSPSPINVVGDGAPNIGDFFFDEIFENGNRVFFNWYGLWGTGSLGDGFFARDDPRRAAEDVGEVAGAGIADVQTELAGKALAKQRGTPHPRMGLSLVEDITMKLFYSPRCRRLSRRRASWSPRPDAESASGRQTEHKRVVWP